jgi:hypothetical protein
MQIHLGVPAGNCAVKCRCGQFSAKEVGEWLNVCEQLQTQYDLLTDPIQFSKVLNLQKRVAYNFPGNSLNYTDRH